MSQNQQVIAPTSKVLAAIPPKAGGHVEAFIPRSIEEIKWVVGLLIDAGLAPDSFKNDPKKITIAVLKGLEVGLPPLMAVSNIAVINGRASIWGDAALALVQSRSVITKFEVEEIGTVPDAAETSAFPPEYGFAVRIWRKGQDAPYTGKFTVGDAKRAKLWMNPSKAPWMAHPKRMLKIRATAFPLRDGFADCLSGLSIREEVEDLPPQVEKPSDDFLADRLPAQPAIAHQPESEVAIWRIADELEFGAEFARLLTEAVEKPEDIEALVKANEDRLTPEQAEAAEKRRQELGAQ